MDATIEIDDGDLEFAIEEVVDGLLDSKLEDKLGDRDDPDEARLRTLIREEIRALLYMGTSRLDVQLKYDTAAIND
jgi:hypothetical protein